MSPAALVIVEGALQILLDDDNDETDRQENKQRISMQILK